MPDQTNGVADFNATKIATTVTKHDEEFISVKGRLDLLEAKFGNNEKIADTLCEVSEKASKMDEMIGKRFLKLLQHDVDIKKEVGELVNRTDRSYFFASVKRIGKLVVGFLYSILLLGIGAAIAHYFKYTRFTRRHRCKLHRKPLQVSVVRVSYGPAWMK